MLQKFQKQIKQISEKRDHTHIPDHILTQAIEIGAQAVAQRQPGQTVILISEGEKLAKKDRHDRTLIVVLTEDRPFLIDSVTAECTRQKYTVEGIFHNTLLVERDKKGGIISVDLKTKKDTNGRAREALVIMTLEGTLGQTKSDQLRDDLLNVVTDVEFATKDWHEMRQAVLDTIDDLDKTKKAPDIELFDEYKELLRYLYDNNFTLLGFREYKLTQKKDEVVSEISKGSGLGLLSDAKKPVYINKSRQSLPPELQKKRAQQPTLTIAKVNKRSTVHRAVQLDAVAVKLHDEKGNVIGEKLFIGLFTSVTYSRSIQDIPYLRHKVNQVVEKTGYGYNSHNYRALMHILEKYPRDELFQIETSLLQKYAVSIMALQEQPKLALYTREDPFKRYISCLVYIPREKYETGLRLRIERILEEELGGTSEIFQTVLDDSPLARVIYRINTEPTTNLGKKHNFKKIEQRLIDAARTWQERIRGVLLAKAQSERAALYLTEKYQDAFPAGYQEDKSADEAYSDIVKIEELLVGGKFALDLYHCENNDFSDLNLKVYFPNRPVILSDVLPILENFGFDVLSEKPYEISINHYNFSPMFTVRDRNDGGENYETVWIHDFRIQFKNKNHARAVKDIKDVFEDAIRAIATEEAENDALNALVPMAKMPWRDVLVLRSVIKYMRQTTLQYTPDYMMQAVTDHPEIANLFLELFYAYHKPSHSKDARKKLIATNADKVLRALDDVASYDQDRILRSILSIMQGMLRTNFFQNKSYVSFKLKSGDLDILPLPKPMVEIFVYSLRVEGIHLRAGKVARGGLRWSDRHEDFRTEVLGLMKAQNVKNAVIVPVGSKGGFIVKNPPSEGGREAYVAEGIACYKIFLRGLLDITDNIVDHKIVPPKDVVRHDEDDPYLVVAADKGTATFSDIANGLSEEYNFWLGDAFASGGSAGYDHKVMGITARGAWESVKRHFRELGQNIQEEDFDVIGVGDMGGDVFGNGMLLSKHIRLVGAFNHLHIFCDPNPNPETSYKERERLFKEVKGWDAYNESYLSKGGKIYSRSDKSLKLTLEIQERFNLDRNEVSPQELMHAMLQAKTDLMWFGGIGTYIKAPSENNAAVGDKANDLIRVDAHQVRARVVGEGANLGVTHAARICMNLLGIKSYADFIDNSGGVNSSDLEVNIKILFQHVMQKGKLSLKDRNKLLQQMTDDVASLVLRNNYQQTQAISMSAHNAYEKLSSHVALIEYLETHFGLARKIEYLPDNAAIEMRSKSHSGLTTAELSTLISYTKNKLYQDIISSELPNDPAFQDWLFEYFPPLLRKKYEEDMKDHSLRREIITTQVANSIVNRMGPSYVMAQSSKTGVAACTVARVYFVVREIFDIRDLYSEIEALDNKVSADMQIEAFDAIAAFIDYASTWFLKHFRAENLKESELLKTGERFKKGVQQLQKSLMASLPKSSLDFIENRRNEFETKGFPKDLANRLALLPIMNTACDIIHIGEQEKHDLMTVARVYHGLNEVLGFVWLRAEARSLEPNSRWESDTLKGLVDRLYVTQAVLTKRIVRETCSGKKCPINPVHEWAMANDEAIQPILDMLRRMREAESVDFAMLTSIEVRLEQIV